MDLSPFLLCSFSAFLYEMAAMSEQYFNRNEPKSHFRINMYIYQLIQMSLCEGAGSGSRGVSGGGMNLNEFTAVLDKPLCHISSSSAVCSFLHVLHRRTVRRNSGASERD